MASSKQVRFQARFRVYAHCPARPARRAMLAPFDGHGKPILGRWCLSLKFPLLDQQEK
jgi:hypothetical protein